MSSSADPPTVFLNLAGIIYEQPDPAQVFAAICVAATLLVPGCDHASVLMRRDGAYRTMAATDDIARQIDTLERHTGDGPCVDAIEMETPQIEPNLTAPSHWPRLAARIVAETPVRGAMGFRLLVDGRKVGALNLFSDTADRFDSDCADLAVILASFAGVAAYAAARGEQAELLHRGLLNNREIGKAIGMLMVLHSVSEKEAFEMLRHISQAMNVKLADIAREVIKRGGKLPG
ncbi:MAG TPA: GAF and ANTAR domain-containing protein [Mycobacterium sp.]|nr:GAF and ANTAR domain-containing protein [Mycobacterium sp.]